MGFHHKFNIGLIEFYVAQKVYLDTLYLPFRWSSHKLKLDSKIKEYIYTNYKFELDSSSVNSEVESPLLISTNDIPILPLIVYDTFYFKVFVISLIVKKFFLDL